jgi:hypothetical protein
MGISKVIIIVNAEINDKKKIVTASPATEKMVSCLKKAIQSELMTGQDETEIRERQDRVPIEIISTASLWSETNRNDRGDSKDNEIIYCPLTIELPHAFDFSGKQVFLACKDIKARRRWVEEKLSYQTHKGDRSFGDLWLPAIVLKDGIVYGEAIGEGEIPNFFQQPVDLPNTIRNSLHNLGNKLLKSISAVPAVYLLQFSLQGREIIFDRLWPFPAAPALASLKAQQPDLFTCYWYCLSGKSIDILDLS